MRTNYNLLADADTLATPSPDTLNNKQNNNRQLLELGLKMRKHDFGKKVDEHYKNVDSNQRGEPMPYLCNPLVLSQTGA